ncbi:MAG: metal ABC transporter permease [Tannerella sp.]|jgi:zinc transport system permease protein|nr:metal ABC transporter permease [Tannerella sp.]
MDILQYTFFQNALIGSLLIAVACGIVGTYIVVRRLVLISGGITHASFGGIGLGFYLGINPFLTALGFAVVSAFGVKWVSRSQQVREDSAIAAVWSLGMAVGAVFMVMTPGYAPNLSSYLFGNILTITRMDIVVAAIAVAALCVFFAIRRREIVYSAFDRDFALTQRIPVKVIENVMTVFIAVTIVLSIRLAGIMLLMSLLTVPQMTVNLFTSDYCKIVVGSIVLGFLSCLGGLFLSYIYNIPTGAFIIILLLFCFMAAKTVLWLKRKKINSRMSV